MADKRISQLIERVDIANNDVLPIVASGATTTNKVTISTIQDWMQSNLDVGVTSVGLTMPSAFQVSGSPITTSGNITVTATGTASQYIRGDGTLADFPTGGGGGGASVSYYLNGSVSQGTIGGIAYREMNKVPILGAGTDFSISSNGYIASFITDAGDPGLLEIPGGNWNFETYFQASSGGGTPSFYIELYKISGSTATLIASNSANPEFIAFGTTTTAYFSSLAVPTTTLAITDRLALRYYVTHSGRTITLHTENSNLCQIITTFTTGLTALNGLTAQVQNFATGTSGTNFGITSSGNIHTFNLPTASATNRGALSSADWITFNSKQDAGNYVTTDTTQTITGQKTFSSSSLRLAANGTADAVVLRNVSGTTGSDGGATTIGFNGSNNIFVNTQNRGGFVISFNNSVSNRTYTLQDASGTLAFTSDLGNYIQGSGTADSIPKFTGTRTLANSAIRDTTSTVIISKNVSVDNGASQAINLTPANAGTTNRIETTGTLPLAIITSGASITLAAGGVTPQITLASTGAVTLTGALNGTSASFTGTVNSDGRFAAVTNQTAPSDGSAYFYKSSSGAVVSGFQFLAETGGAGSRTTKLTIDSTGAATFSSSVSANELFIANSSTLANYVGAEYRYLGTLYGFSKASANDGELRHSIGPSAGWGGKITFYTDTTEKMRITSAGNVGIGTASPTQAVQIGDGTSSRYIRVSTNNADTLFGSDSIGAMAGTTNSFPLYFITNSTERMRITSGGTVGINNSAPNTTYVLDVLANNSVYNTRFHQPSSSTSAYNSIIISGAMTGAIGYMGVGGSATGNTSFRDSVVVGSQSSHPLVLNTNDTERMRITSGGNVGIGTNNPNGGRLHIADSGADNTGLYINNNTFGHFFTKFSYQGSVVGSISYNGSNTVYTTTSDYRLKENVNPVESALSKLSQLKPCTFNFKSNPDEKVMGFIAHEVQEVIPQAVIGQKDEVRIEQVEISPTELDEEGNVITEAVIQEKEVPVYQGIDHSILVPLLVAAMQEQQEQIKSLTEQVEALKSQING